MSSPINLSIPGPIDQQFLKQERTNAISNLNIDDASQKRLHAALTTTGLWPRYFLSTDAYARRPLTTDHDPWSEEDRRALLLVMRTVPDIDLKVDGQTLFPNRIPSLAVDTQWKALLCWDVDGWDRANDYDLWQMFVADGEGFKEKARARFGMGFSDFDLERALAGALEVVKNVVGGSGRDDAAA